MNNRIEELLKQSTHDVLGVKQVNQKQFAELIVRECVKVMYDNAIERKVSLDIDKTPTHYAAAVLEHFGVDE
jgi:hypothetical protein